MVFRTSPIRIGIVLHPSRGPDLPGPRATHLPGLYHLPGCDNLLRHTIAQTVVTSTGISTCCPSTTPLGLALGPYLPWADEPSPGTLGHSAGEFLPPLSLLMPAFALGNAPRSVTLPLRSRPNAPLPIFRCRSFGTWLSPVTLSAQDFLTSELLRTL
jgi:hypothetical protein